jgi:hypothetical protein
MQDISSILTSLHAMEADLAPTNEKVVSSQARNTVPTYDANIEWLDQYKIFDNPNDTKQKLTQTLWKDVKPCKRAPIFLDLYDKEYKLNQKNLAQAITASQDAMQATELLLQTQKEDKQTFDTRKQEMIQMCENLRKIDQNDSKLVQELERTKDTVKQIMDKLGDDMRACKKSINQQQETMKKEKVLSSILYKLDLKRFDIFEEIIGEVEQNGLDLNQKYTTTLIEQATSQAKIAFATKNLSFATFQEAESKLKKANTLETQNNKALADFTKSHATNISDISTTTKLIKSISAKPQASVPASQQPAQNVDLLQEQQKAQHVAQETANEALSQSTENLHTQKHALVAQEVELAQVQLAQAKGEITANTLVSEQIVLLDNANIVLQQQHVAEAQEKLADVQEQLRKTEQALAGAAAPERGTILGLMDSLSTLIVGRKANVDVDKQKEEVAKGQLQVDLTSQAQQQMEAHEKATAAAAACQKAATDAQAQTKEDIQSFCDATVAYEQSKEDYEEYKVLLATATAKLEQARTRKDDAAILSVQTLIQYYESLILEKQKEIDTTVQKKNEKEAILRTSLATYNHARQYFHDAQVVQQQNKLHNAPEVATTQMPELAQAYMVQCMVATHARHVEKQKQTTVVHAHAEAAKENLVEGLAELQALEKQLETLNIDAPSDEIHVPPAASQTNGIEPHSAYATAAKTAQDMIAQKDNKLNLFQSAAAKCADLTVRITFHKKCIQEAKQMLDKHKGVAVVSGQRQKALDELASLVQDHKIECARLDLVNNENILIMHRALAELEAAITEANKAIEKLESMSKVSAPPKNAVPLLLIEAINMKQILTKKVTAAEKTFEQNTQQFETLLVGIENKLKQTEAPAAQEQPASADTASADTAAAAAAAAHEVQTLLATKDTKLRAWQEAIAHYCKFDVYLKCMQNAHKILQARLTKYTEEIAKLNNTQATFAPKQIAIDILTKSIQSNQEAMDNANAKILNQTEVISSAQAELRQAIDSVNEAIKVVISLENDSAKIEEWNHQTLHKTIALQAEIDRQMLVEQQEIIPPNHALEAAEASIKSADAAATANDKAAADKQRSLRESQACRTGRPDAGP